MFKSVKNRSSLVAKSLLTLAALSAFSLSASGASYASDATSIRVGVSAGPHAEIMEVVKKVAADQKLDIKIVEFTDYVFPNQALASKDLEANSFQHEPYLKNQIGKTGWKIVPVGKTITLPMAVYSNKYKAVADIPNGARIGIPNDPTNGSRGLRILDQAKLIKLQDPNSVTASVLDIAENPKKLRFVELDAAQIARSLPDLDAAAINSNYAVQAGLDPVNGSILREPLESPWVNIIAVREEDKDKPWVAKLVAAYNSEPVKEFVTKRFKGSLVPAW